MTTTTLAVLVPLLPFLGAVAGLLLGRTAPGFVRPLAVLPPLAALVLAVVVAVRQGGDQAVNAATELTPTGSVPIELALHIDGFAALVAVLVGLVATCVQIYSTGYLRDDPRYPSYAALVSLFTSAMLLVVYSGDLMVLLVGWEIMGICSYFLVGHYWETPEARAASLKAFLVTKLGDVPFLIGLFALAADAGSFRITKILGNVASGGLDHPTLIALLLLAGVAGKSAQFPLHTWLPDAMAGPTPVSALIHAATMVAAGVYFVARLLPVFAASSAALVVLAVMAAVTMAGSALAALAQDDIKRVLAYSTIGQLGYMTGALAVGDRGAAVFHLLSHGAFKALLFLGAGVIIHAAGTNSLAAMSRMKDLRARVPDAYWTMTVALLALAAIPPFSGFFSKEAVLGAAEHVATGHAEGIPGAVGLDRPRRRPGHGPAHRRVRDAPVAPRLPRPGTGGPRPRQAAHRHERRPLGARRPLARLRTRHRPTARLVRRHATSPRPSPPPSSARAWRWSAASSRTAPGGTPSPWRPAYRSARSRPTPRETQDSSRPRPSPATRPRTETWPPRPTRRTRAASCSARCTATRPSASTSTPCTRHCSSAPCRPPPRSSGSSTARSSTPTYAARAPCPAGSARPSGVPRPAICRPM